MRIFLMVVLWGLALIPPGPLSAKSPTPDSFLYGMNYYPRNGIWDLMWTAYDRPAIEADFGRIAGLGFNSVRIFLQFEVFHAPVTRPQSEKSLAHLLDTAQKHQLRVLITLFDWTRPYDPNWDQDTLGHMRNLVTRFNGHPAVLGWDLKNEPDLDYRFFPSPDYVNRWLRKALAELKTAAGEKPVTVGWLYPSADGTVDGAQDFLSFHHYEGPESIPARVEGLRKRSPATPWVLEEFGFSTVRGTADETEQARRLTGAIRAVIESRGAGIFLWALHDFDPKIGRDRPAAENTFGLFDGAGRAKAAVRHLTPPCLLFYPPAGKFMDRVPFAAKVLTACFRSGGPSAELRLTDRRGTPVLKVTAPLTAEPVHCASFSVHELWGGLVGRGFTAEIVAPELTALGGGPARECRISLDDYFR